MSRIFYIYVIYGLESSILFVYKVLALLFPILVLETMYDRFSFCNIDNKYEWVVSFMFICAS